MHIFTSANLNYLPKARVLANSLKKYHPEIPFTLMLCERPGSVDVNWEKEPFDQVLHIEDLGIPVPNLSSWIFGHSVVELCTAVKPFACKEIFKRNNAKIVVYLDPDIQVFDSLRFIQNHLKENGVLLTPHMLEPAPSKMEVELHEISCLRHGTFNLGFFAIERQLGKRFLEWWCERLLNYCHNNIPRGLFTDQRWVDLAPSFFPETSILRDSTCNVASWNVSRRLISLGENGRYYVDGRLLRFFHFSGFDSSTHDRIIEQLQPDNTALQKMTEEYHAALAVAGQKDFAHHPWSYGRFDNAQPIEMAYRSVYRNEQQLQKRFQNPFITGENGGYFLWCKKHLDPWLPSPVSKLLVFLKKILKRFSLKYRVRFKRYDN
jgi:hypothetical protein